MPDLTTSGGLRSEMASPASPLQRLSTFKEANSSNTTVNPLETLASDPIFSAFLSPSFDSAVFSSQALTSNSAASRAESLQNSIRLLDLHLRQLVLHHHDPLLLHLSSLRHAHSSLPSLRLHLSSLRSSLRRSRLDLSDPRRLLLSRSSLLSRLLSTADLLSASAKLLRLSHRLRDLLSPRPDLAKAAELHRQIHLLHADHDLAGIAVIDDEMRWLGSVGARLRDDATLAVERGMDESNQNDVWCGLQVFYNLGELRVTVDAIVAKYKAAGVKSVGIALDMKAISAAGGGGGFGPGGVQRSGTPQIGSGRKAGDALWERMGRCMDELHKVVAAVWQLQAVLSKKRIPFTQVLFLHEVWQEGDPLLTDRVWEALVKSFTNQMKSAFTASSFVKEVFTNGYPKLLSLVENFLERVSRDTNVKGALPALTLEGKDQMIAAIEVFQTAFLAQCLGRLSDHVNNIFPVTSRGSVPSKDQISRITLRIQEEIETVKLNENLMVLVLQVIGKVLLLLSQRAEYQVSTGPEARQVSGPVNPAQLKNFTICQYLQDIHSKMSVITSSLPDVAMEVLSPSLGSIYGVACDSVTSLFQAMLDRLEACILKIHEQDFGAEGMDATMDNNASNYMDEFQKAAIHFRSEFLSKLVPTTSLKETISMRLVRGMASRILTFFIRHAALVRPLSESGKLRMARDMAELELAVGQNLFPVEQLGAPYRALRAFRPVLFLEMSQLIGSPLLQDLPASVILHHLYCRGPDELQSPLQRNKLTPLQYSLWLDSQGEDQIWKGIKATLDDYELKGRASGDKEFSPVHSIMLQIGSALSGTASQ